MNNTKCLCEQCENRGNCSNYRPFLTEGAILQEYIEWYKRSPHISKEELYKSWYGKNTYKEYFEKGTLEKYL